VDPHNTAASDLATTARAADSLLEGGAKGRLRSSSVAAVLSRVRRNWIHIGLILAVFALFVANAVGLFEIILEVEESSLSFPAVLRSTEFLVLVAVGLTLSILLPLLAPIPASLLTLACMVPIFWVGYLPSPERSLVPLEYALFTVLMLFVVNVLISYYAETHRKQQLIDAFGQYLPPAVVSRITRNPEELVLEGEARELSVMFCDVHNFTGIAEGLGPRQLAALLNTLFTPLTEVLYKHHATIDKYIGDAIMAFWGAPIEDPHHAQHALAAAIEMQDVVHKLGPTLREHGWPELSIGIGINTGLMNVGDMGSKYRMAYTVIGDAVNLAARLQELTRVYNARIIVGEETRRAFPALVYRELGLVKVKGKNRLVRIYEPSNPAADPESTMIENMNRHNQALKHYYNREWDSAEALFRELREKAQHDPLYPYYLSRIEEFRKVPPPPDWQGQVEFSIK